MIAMLLLSGGCGLNANRPVAQPAVRAQLIDELRRIYRELGVRIPVRAGQVEWGEQRSTVVPGLVYHTAAYDPPGLHSQIGAIVATRESTSRVLRSATDWIVLASGWSPGGARDAHEACRELIRAGGGQGSAFTVPTPLTPENLSAQGVAFQASEVMMKLGSSPPAVQHVAGLWRAEIWVPEVRRGFSRYAMRYRCEFPDRPQRSPTLTPLDSVPGIPLP